MIFAGRGGEPAAARVPAVRRRTADLCGAGLAQLEATLALATLARSATLDLLPGTSVRARADVTLHPCGPVIVTVAPPLRVRHPARAAT